MLVNVQSNAKIFGIGLSRTGTKSLNSALDILGLTMIHYPNDTLTLRELSDENCNFTILKYVHGITDITVVPFYQKLDVLFPGSKFILTIREKRSWLQSVKKHWDCDLLSEGNSARQNDYETNFKVTQLLKQRVFGHLNFNEAQMSDVYDRHCQQVNDYFRDRPTDLLVLNICNHEGWEKLCPFLGCVAPEHPFPNIQTDVQLIQQTLHTCDYPLCS